MPARGTTTLYLQFHISNHFLCLCVVHSIFLCLFANRTFHVEYHAITACQVFSLYTLLLKMPRSGLYLPGAIFISHPFATEVAPSSLFSSTVYPTEQTHHHTPSNTQSFQSSNTHHVQREVHLQEPFRMCSRL